MTITFRDATEAAKVKAGRKSSRPSYYNADQRTDVAISEDFEAALILLPAGARQEARQKLTTQNTPVERTQKRDAVLQAAMTVEFENANAQQSELEQDIQTYQSFKSDFAQYGEVGEIGLLLRDAQLDIEEKLLAYDRAQHRLVCMTVLNNRLANGGISEDLDRERKSWSGVLTEYSGV